MKTGALLQGESREGVARFLGVYRGSNRRIWLAGRRALDDGTIKGIDQTAAARVWGKGEIGCSG